MDNTLFLDALASGLNKNFNIIYCQTHEYGVSGSISMDVIFKQSLYVCSVNITGTRVEISFANYCVHENIVVEDIADPSFDPDFLIKKIQTALSEKALRRFIALDIDDSHLNQEVVNYLEDGCVIYNNNTLTRSTLDGGSQYILHLPPSLGDKNTQENNK